MQVMRINNLDKTDRVDEYHECVPLGTRWWGGLSGQRRFVPRASTAVNYKFAPLGARNGDVTVGANGAKRKQGARRKRK
jgi:hypothetical protein